MPVAEQHGRMQNSPIFALCGWTFVLGLGVWDLMVRTGTFGAWFQTGVAAMGVVKAGWSFRTGDR